MVAVRCVVDPVFQMVLIASLMVQPGGAVAFFLALSVVGAADSLPVLGTAQNSTGDSLLKSWVRPCQYSPQRKQFCITSILWWWIVL